MEKTLQERIQELLWEAAELQAQSFTSRIKMDMADEVPTDAATLNALTAALKLHGVHLGSVGEKDPIDEQREALRGLDELKNKLKQASRRPSLDEDDIMSILQ